MGRKLKYDISTSYDEDNIYFHLKDIERMTSIEFQEGLWDIINSTNWGIKMKNIGTKEEPINVPQYLYATRFEKTLHQIVIDYYFGEEVRIAAYKKGMIIEHLNNDGLDCRIENLYFLKATKNKYKGSQYDKLAEESLSKFAFRMCHDVKNKSFQILIGFTQEAKLSTDLTKPLKEIRLLYTNTTYDIVFQDADDMLEKLHGGQNLALSKDMYRFTDWEAGFGEYIQPTKEEVEAKVQAGNVITRNGKLYMVMGDPNRCRITEIPKKEDWTK